MPNKKFSRCIEDFTCEECGQEVKGDGYTNHCPACLWAKHVDVNPGDRSANCDGMMKPVRAEYIKGEFVIIHRCEKCGKETRNKAAKNDDREKLYELAG